MTLKHSAEIGRRLQLSDYSLQILRSFKADLLSSPVLINEIRLMGVAFFADFRTFMSGEDDMLMQSLIFSL